MFNWLTGGIAGVVEKIATEWIETDKEKAEAQAVMLKTLDPNGLMRRQISKTVSILYVIYILIALILLIIQAFDLSPLVVRNGLEQPAVDIALTTIKELFTPITTLFGIIVTASFGVNMTNSIKNK